ncbi:hypothetical protein SISNIDRAFT_468391 [Sistotremastrum niveocremeum HHB9708]|uniref:Uncharacterized protein n=1 Tax=Sistotremastrum niveocremeum HHB9708 TaxID=1314777 RepID=A0A164RJH6_9AGAM|nr:hypothetical protein SISNIDRAFT_468391 [Sistotremastrum niveocremeum HHB9708]
MAQGLGIIHKKSIPLAAHVWDLEAEIMPNDPVIHKFTAGQRFKLDWRKTIKESKFNQSEITTGNVGAISKNLALKNLIAVVDVFKRRYDQWRTEHAHWIRTIKEPELDIDNLEHLQKISLTHDLARAKRKAILTRKNQRKVKLCAHRKQILESLIEQKTPEENSYRWLLSVVEYPRVPLPKNTEELGNKGVSSDESDRDEKTHQSIYRVKTFRWRHPALTAYLDGVDDDRRWTNDERQRKPGAGFRDRRRTGNTSLTPAVGGMHSEIYSPDYLQHLPPAERAYLAPKLPRPMPELQPILAARREL